MAHKRILAFSSSRTGNLGYLETAAPIIKSFLGNEKLRIAFVPFASADNDYEQYGNMVKDGLGDTPYTIEVVTPQNVRHLLSECDVIMVGGGNTFKLLHDLYELDVLSLIQEKVNTGTPYIGWSAGSNITGMTIGTTNDMPIVEPESFDAMQFFPFQINPHYYNFIIPGHNGETRDQRLTEYLKVNVTAKIVCLPEGTALLLEGNYLQLIGNVSGNLLQLDPALKTVMKEELTAGSDLSFLL